jgi:Tfp pilus assembly protein PilF
VELLSRDNLPQAEAKFKEALACDMFYGPAHNNLGTVYYKQGKLYPAAWEYQLAASAMPEKAGPVNNQGLVQERAGKLEEAAKLYEKAAKLSGEAMQVNANLARTYIRLGRRDSVTADLLHKVTANDTRPEWVSWAQRELATIGMAADHATTAPASAPATPPAPAPKPTPTTKPAPTTSPLL